jgi:Mlc titration factor MtfA (ptsG expression regulator)
MLLSRRRRDGLPAGWREILTTRSAQWNLLDDDERTRVGELAETLLVTKRWEAAHGFVITDEVRTVVAAHAALLVLQLDVEHYDEVGTIVVRAGPMRRREPVPHWGRVEGVVEGSPAPVDGEAHGGAGPVMVNWNAARREARNPGLGRDVVLHEFAHKLDMLDGTIDGTPPIADGAARQRWIDVCTAEYEAVRRGEPNRVLRPYAGVNPGEFFAVATEAFFTQPLLMEADKPELYGVLAAYYRQHPAQRIRIRLVPASPQSG